MIGFYKHYSSLVFSDAYLCGYLIDWCGDTAGDVYMQQLNLSDWQTAELAAKPGGDNYNNNYLDGIYQLSQPQANPSTF